MTKPGLTIGLLARAADHLDQMREELGADTRFETWRPGETKDLAEAVAACQAVVVGPDAAHHGFGGLDIRGFTTLKLVVLPFAGHDWLPPHRLPPGCVACNTYEHDGAIAEYVLAAILHMEVRLDAIDAQFRDGDWSDWGAPALKVHGELAGKR